MKISNLTVLAVALVASGLLAVVALAAPVTLDSPNGNLHVVVDDTRPAGLTYTVTYKGRSVVEPSPLGITVEGQNLGEGATLGTPATKVNYESYATRGVHAMAFNYYREAVVPVAAKTPWVLEWRAFNDGVAYRYRVAGTGQRLIGGEASGWQLPAGSTIWFQDAKNRSYEGVYQMAALDSFNQAQVIMAPATVKVPGVGYAMLSEANLVNYSDMALRPSGPNRFQAWFQFDGNGWSQQGEILSPWRVTMFSPDLNGLVNSDLIKNLAPPPAPELVHAPWIVPGRSTWHWMVTGSPRLEDQRQWVDWTKQLGFEYYMIDDGWIQWKAEGKDQWACMKDVVDYARTQGVKIWAWVHTKEVTKPADRLAYFKHAKAIGLVGLKIDFMGPPNAEWVKWYDETLRDAAAAQLMVNFHGAVKPTGRERTWPNEMTREAIHGRENGKSPAVHDTSVPFLRYVQGHADYTPTDFRIEKLKGASWARELAEAVVYTSPLLVLSGSPQNYQENPAIDVIKALPATWDETVVLPGSEIGETAAFARRHGKDWFIGVVNGKEGRTLPIDLRFLGTGSYQIDKFADSKERNNAYDRTQDSVTRADSLSVELRVEGGFVARLRRVE